MSAPRKRKSGPTQPEAQRKRRAYTLRLSAGTLEALRQLALERGERPAAVAAALLEAALGC